MYYYLVCKFLREKELSQKPYVYSVSKENYDKVKIGYQYKIRNSDGYIYRGSGVEVTGKYETEKLQVVNEEKLVDDDVFSFNSIAVKQLVELLCVGKNQKADILETRIKPNPSRSIECPIYYKDRGYSCIGDIDYSLKDFVSSIDTETINLDKSISYMNNEYECCFRNLKIETKNKEKKTMNKIFGNVAFGKYIGNDIKMSVSGLAYRTGDGKYVAYDKNKLTLTDVSDFVFDMEGLLYLFPVSIKDIKVGDIIRNGEYYVIVKDVVNSNFLEVIDPRNNEVKTIMPLRNIFGFDFYTKVISLMGEGAFGTIDESNPFGNMLPFFLMMGDKNNDGFDPKTFMLMTSLNGGVMDFQSNPWLMYMLMDNKGDMGDILPLMMISNGGFNFSGTKKICECECKESNKKS